MSRTKAEAWLYDAGSLLTARRHPESHVGCTVAGRVFLRLATGWATPEELAEAAWGPRWPDGWLYCLRVHMSALKREHGVRTERQIRYRLGNTR